MPKTIRINGIDVPVIPDEMTGAEIKRTAGIPEDRVLVQQESDQNTIVPDARRIRVADGSVFAHHARHSKATECGGRSAMSMRDWRIRWEAAQIAAGYPGLRVADDNEWLLISEYRLPTGWVPDRTTVLLVPPATYPESAPDGFYLGARLRRRNGTELVNPGHYFQGHNNPYAELGYYWYCLEDPDRKWDPDLDSLVTFVEAIRTYLGAVD